MLLFSSSVSTRSSRGHRIQLAALSQLNSLYKSLRSNVGLGYFSGFSPFRVLQRPSVPRRSGSPPVIRRAAPTIYYNNVAGNEQPIATYNNNYRDRMCARGVAKVTLSVIYIRYRSLSGRCLFSYAYLPLCEKNTLVA